MNGLNKLIKIMGEIALRIGLAICKIDFTVLDFQMRTDFLKFIILYGFFFELEGAIDQNTGFEDDIGGMYQYHVQASAILKKEDRVAPGL